LGPIFTQVRALIGGELFGNSKDCGGHIKEILCWAQTKTVVVFPHFSPLRRAFPKGLGVNPILRGEHIILGRLGLRAPFNSVSGFGAQGLRKGALKGI